MKKYTYLLAAAGLLFMMSSCGKTYVCECKAFSPTGEITKHEFKGKKRAERKCAELGANEAADGPHCELKN